MIDASFDRLGRTAAITGAYQYDTGQRLRLSGLPSPDELGARDDFLSGDLVTVQVQFAFRGDDQTRAALALWNDDQMAWMCAVPDEYLTRHEAVNVYVYVSYGSAAYDSGVAAADGEEAEPVVVTRNKTMYTGVFTPIRRPAPEGTLSDDQIARWKNMQVELVAMTGDAMQAVESAAMQAQDARTAAEEAASAAQEAAEAAADADEARQRVEALESRWGGLTVRTTELAPGSEATATLNGSTLTLGIPKGAPGRDGSQGDKGPADLSFALDSNNVLTITRR